MLFWVYRCITTNGGQRTPADTEEAVSVSQLRSLSLYKHKHLTARRSVIPIICLISIWCSTISDTDSWVWKPLTRDGSTVNTPSSSKCFQCFDSTMTRNIMSWSGTKAWLGPVTLLTCSPGDWARPSVGIIASHVSITRAALFPHWPDNDTRTHLHSPAPMTGAGCVMSPAPRVTAPDWLMMTAASQLASQYWSVSRHLSLQ